MPVGGVGSETWEHTVLSDAVLEKQEAKSSAENGDQLIRS